MRAEIKIDATKHIAARREFEQRQLPYAVAAALTGTVKVAQGHVQQNVRGAFKLRNKWTEQGIRIKPADKNSKVNVMTADVHTDTANRSTGAPDYMGRQEEGGEKVPIAGHQHIAVPTKYLRRMCPGVIPQELRPRALLGAVNGRYAGRNRKGQTALRNQKIVRGFVFFVQVMKSGAVAIMGRNALDADSRNAYPFYILTKEVHVKKSRLEMVGAVKVTVEEEFSKQWDETWKRLYANGIRM